MCAQYKASRARAQQFKHNLDAGYERMPPALVTVLLRGIGYIKRLGCGPRKHNTMQQTRSRLPIET